MGVDVFIECSGAAVTVNSGLALLKKRGQFTQVGLFGKDVPVNLDALVFKEIVITGSISHSRKAWERALKLVGEGKIKLKPLVSTVYNLADWEKGFRDFEEKRGIKILIKPD